MCQISLNYIQHSLSWLYTKLQEVNSFGSLLVNTATSLIAVASLLMLGLSGATKKEAGNGFCHMVSAQASASTHSHTHMHTHTVFMFLLVIQDVYFCCLL